MPARLRQPDAAIRRVALTRRLFWAGFSLASCRTEKGAGVDKGFDICAAQIRRAMMLADCPTIDDIGPDLVRPAG